MTAKSNNIEKQCDDLFALLVKQRAGRRCIKTGTDKELECAHILGRGRLSTRFDFKNAVCLTHKWHRYYTDHPSEWKEFIDSKFGAGYYDNLKALSEALTTNMTKAGYLDLYERLNSEWNSGKGQ